MALLTFCTLKRLQWDGHTGRMDDPRIPKRVMVCCRAKNPMGRPTGRSEDAVWRYAEDCLHTLIWTAVARQQVEELRFGSQWPEHRMMMTTMMIIS